MRIQLNDAPVVVAENALVADVLAEQNLLGKKGIAVAVNNSVVPQKEWQSTTLNENDKLLIITATQGG